MTPSSSSWTDPLSGYQFAAALAADDPLAARYLSRATAQSARAVIAPAEPWTADEIAEVATFNEAVGNPGGASLARDLLTGNAVAVVTGQQPTLFASPIYNLLKAATAIVRAQQLASAAGRPVVPVFWVASDDDDFLELRDCRVPARDGSAFNLGTLASRGPSAVPGSPAFLWSLDDSWDRLMEALTRLLPPGPGRESTLHALHAAGAPPATFESLFCRLLVSYLGDGRLLFVAPRLVGLRRRFGRLLRADLSERGAAASHLAARNAQMAATGFRGGIERTADNVNAFLIENGLRMRLRWAGDCISVVHPVTGAELRRMAPSDLLALHDADPTCLAPNVVTRPMLQNEALPVAAYVGGPGEVAYLAQLDAAFDALGARRCPVELRAMATLVPAAPIAHLEAAAKLPSGAFLSNPHAALESLLSQDGQFGALLQAAMDLEATLAHGLEAMGASPGAQQPTVQSGLRKTSESLRRNLARLRARLARQYQMAEAGTGRQLADLLAVLRPAGGPQERMLSPLAFGGLLPPREIGDAILKSVADQPAGHRFIPLDKGSAA